MIDLNQIKNYFPADVQKNKFKIKVARFWAFTV